MCIWIYNNKVAEWVGFCVCVWEREKVCVCVTERERESLCVCVREIEKVYVCVCERERKSVCLCEREREKIRVRSFVHIFQHKGKIVGCFSIIVFFPFECLVRDGFRISENLFVSFGSGITRLLQDSCQLVHAYVYICIR